MGNKKIFPGMILLGFGAYFIMQQFQISFFQGFYSWPTFFIIVGLAFLLEGYLGKSAEAILPGVILTGFGLHFHIAPKADFWPDHIGILIFIIALGFFLAHQKLKSGLFNGVLFLLLALLLLFDEKIFRLFNLSADATETVLKFWPVVFIALGLYFLLFKKK